ncbi:hypothetical protein Pyn_29877 [Prunus yedoensis var. nudiflora]|uniref:Cyclic nucleotide-binding domain-containing protein n=1 Tax=Prunus yedoensis var. nudiflora TaxID=2094558 RepID=A0A314URQ4_PRUYE|nr:hypothetical protein Pyn_29877 [Prunus yedoensis var. nudiflora]
MLQSIDERVLRMICDHLKPVIYTENSYVIRAGEPLDLMIFITQGIIWTFAGDFYGEELLSRISTYISFSDLPICTENVKCHTKVEAFALLAKDLRRVVSEFWWYFPNLKNSELKEKSALSSLRSIRQRNRSKKEAKSIKKEATMPPKSDADREQMLAN